MKKEIEINSLVDWADMDILIKIIPDLTNSFTRRKNYSEYYFKTTEVNIDGDVFDELSQEYELKVDWSSIEIMIS